MAATLAPSVDAGDGSNQALAAAGDKPLVARSTKCPLPANLRQLSITFFLERKLSASGFVHAAMQRFGVTQTTATSMLVHGRNHHYYSRKRLHKQLDRAKKTSARALKKRRVVKPKPSTPWCARTARRKATLNPGEDKECLLIDTPAPWLPDDVQGLNLIKVSRGLKGGNYASV